MRRSVRSLLFVLPLLVSPGIAKAQTFAGKADLASEMPAAGPDNRMRPLLEHLDRTGSHPVAMLERLFLRTGAFGALDHRRATAFAVGGIEILAESMRQRTRIETAGIGRGTRALDRLSAVGIKAGLPLGENDDLSLGVAADMNKRAEPPILAGRKNIKDSGVIADCSWTHGAHLQMALDWRADRSSSSSGVNRSVELAQGATPREHGFGLTLSYLVAGAEASRHMTFGVAAREARIAADDLASMGAIGRQDVQTALFLRTAF